MWAKSTRAVLPLTRENPTIDYPRIETGSDTMLIFVRGGKKMEAAASLYYLTLFDLIQTTKYID
jgi:hypothetical protein